MSKRSGTARKRPIERVWSRVFDLDVAASQTNNLLYTAEDPVTLIRTIVRLYAVPIGATAGLARFDMKIEHLPRAQAVAEATGVSQDLANVEVKQTLMRRALAYSHGDATGSTVPIEIFEDLKSMRKLQNGDTINMGAIASATAVFALVGYVILLFKEA